MAQTGATQAGRNREPTPGPSAAPPERRGSRCACWPTGWPCPRPCSWPRSSVSRYCRALRRGVDYTLITLVATPGSCSSALRPLRAPAGARSGQRVQAGLPRRCCRHRLDHHRRLDLHSSWHEAGRYWRWSCGFVFVGGERLAVRKTLHFLRRRGGDTTRTIILGSNPEARTVARTLEREEWLATRSSASSTTTLPVGHEIGGGHEVIGHRRS